MNLAVRSCAMRALLALPLVTVPTSALASGFAIESQGARAMGFAGAYVAQAADPSAIFYNAGGVGFLKGKQLYVGGAFAGLSTNFVGAGPFPPVGTPESSANGLGVLPTIYYSQQVGDTMVFGIGLNRPFATRSEWELPNDFTGRYICLDCRIQSWSLNPTVAFRLADRFSIGGGVDIRFSDFRMSRRLIADPNPFPAPARLLPSPGRPSSSRLSPRRSSWTSCPSRSRRRWWSRSRRRPSGTSRRSRRTASGHAPFLAKPSRRQRNASRPSPKGRRAW